jgi:hypothetical protein
MLGNGVLYSVAPDTAVVPVMDNVLLMPGNGPGSVSGEAAGNSTTVVSACPFGFASWAFNGCAASKHPVVIYRINFFIYNVCR